MASLSGFRQIGILGILAASVMVARGQNPERARDWGIPFTGTPGPLNAITDVPGVLVGQVTLISGEGPLVKGKGPTCTIGREAHHEPQRARCLDFLAGGSPPILTGLPGSLEFICCRMLS